MTGRSRSGPWYWYVLAAQLVSAGVVTLYVAVAATGAVVTLGDLLTGVVLAVGALLGVAVYPSLFQDAVYVNRTGSEWRPRWWWYFAAGFGVTFLAYGAVRTSGGAGGAAPVVLPFVLVVVSGGVSAVYLYRRHHAVGTP
ncbi:hypothetical protein K933_02561 [Candidatus Halobonum tyrrellensis G22]|uniref:Uncharacterized protein n=1 Tax=Candidatus Halobonum tyrrellensis G22 TaxID=1324957 RepID=V4HPL0_9EURY|nr:hypothetical protein K933_02561 [Candidatus Halobonum tyrrellensis G22]